MVIRLREVVARFKPNAGLWMNGRIDAKMGALTEAKWTKT